LFKALNSTIKQCPNVAAMVFSLLIFATLCVGSHAGTVILGSQKYGGRHHILAVDATTGDHKWTYQLHDADYPALISMSYDGRTAFAYDHYMTMLALDVKSGTKIWSYTAPAGHGFYREYLSGPLLSKDGSTIFFYTSDVQSTWLGALESATGRIKWWFEDKYAGTINPSAGFYPSISPDGATVYWATQSNRLYPVHASNGTLIWESVTPDFPTETTVSPDGSRIFLSGYNQFLMAWWPNGTLAWRSDKTRDYILAKSAVRSDSNIVFTGDYAGYLTAFDTQTGSKLWERRIDWEFHLGARLLVTPDGSVFAAGSAMYKIAANGSVLWQYSKKAYHWEPSGTFCLGDNLVFVPFEHRVGYSDEAHHLFAFNAETGKVVWRKTGFQRSGNGHPSSIAWSPIAVENRITTKHGASASADSLAVVSATWAEALKGPLAFTFMGLLMGTMLGLSICFSCMRSGGRPSGVSPNAPLLGQA